MLTDKQLQEQEAAFKQSLAAFEKCINTPFIPGELLAWMRAVSQAFARLVELMIGQTEQMHKEEFRDIAREDPGLLKRVEEMRKEDGEIAKESERLASAIATLKPRIEQAGADEVVLREELNQFVADAQQFVARVRKQEVTIRTWWVESFTRDRGTVD